MDIKALEGIKKDFSSQFLEEVKAYTLFPEEELAVQNYLQNVAQRLLGDEHDFEKSPIYFGLVDDESVNAFFYSNAASNDSDDENENNKTPKTSGIFFTKGLLETVENEDQLAYVMGHELGHFRQHALRGSHSNSKTEETASDLNAVNMMAKAGYNFVESNKIVNNIFSSSEIGGSFKQDILDDHPNPESRINANEVMITALTKQYMKTHNIAAYDIPVTQIPDTIKNIEKNEKHISFVEGYLIDEKYSELDLEDKIEKLSELLTISETDRVERGYNPHSQIIHPRKMDIYNECASLIGEMREQTPRIVISQSDYEMCMKSKWDLSEEEKAKVAKIVEPYHHESASNMAKTLTTFPYKIVSNEVYETEFQNNEKLKIEYEAKKKNGSLPNLILFEKFFKHLNHDLDKHQSDKNGIIFNTLNIAMAGVEGISLNEQNDFWKSFIGLSNDFLGAKDLSERSQKVGKKLSHFYDAFTYYDSTVNELSSFAEKFSKLKVLDNYAIKDFGDKVVGFPLADVSVGNTAPVMSGYYLEEGIFHVATDVKVDEEHSFIKFGKKYQKEPMVYCLLDKDRTVLQHYNYEEYNEYIQGLKTKVHDEIYNSFAEFIREKIKTTKEFIENPDISQVNFVQLEAMKKMTGLTGLYFNNTEELPQGTPEFWQKYEKAVNEVDEKELTLYKESLSNYDAKFYNIRKEHQSVFAENVSFSKETLLDKFLSEEERNWLSSYNAKEDDVIFDAMNRYVKEKSSTPQEIYAAPLKPKVEQDSKFAKIEEFKKYPSIKSSYFFSRKQQEILTKTYLENVNFDKDYNYKEGYSPVWNITPENLYLEEMQNIGIFMATRPSENLDFSEYKPLYLEQNRKITGLREFSVNTLEDYVESKDHGKQYLMELEVFLAVAKNKGEKLPLEQVSDFATSYVYGDYYAQALDKICADQQNWPDDLSKCAEVLKTLNEKSMLNPKTGLNAFLNVLEKEKDPKKIENALSKIAKIMNSDKLTETEQSAFKNRLLEGSVLWEQSLDDRILSYNVLNNEKLFSEDFVLQNKMLNGFYEDIQALPDEQNKNDKLFHFITSDYRINDPEIRRKYQDAWVDSTYKMMGAKPDDNSAEYHQKMQAYIDKINEEKIVQVFYQDKTKKTINMVDKDEIMRKLATRLVSQQELSAKLKPEPSGIDAFETGDMFEGHAAGVAFDVIKRDLNQNPENAVATINFLLSEGKVSDCLAFQDVLIARDEKAHKEKGYTVSFEHTNRIKKETTSSKLSLLHREFWGYPLEAKAVLINELLEAQVQKGGKEPWEQAFDLVAGRMFPNADEGMSKIGKEFMHSYIKARRPEQRRLYLSAMLVAANENAGTQDPEQSLAKGVKLFLENAGPAAIKLGQAMSSHADVPKFLRDELQSLKSGAAEPARWEVYEWLNQYKTENPNEKLEFGKDTNLGKILGSASYFVTLEKGDDTVIKILRAGAKVESEEEFKVFETMLYDLSEKGVFDGGVDSFLRLVKQAKEAVEVETNLDVGHSQLETAKSIYPKSVEINNKKFDIHVADWPKYGKRWAELERAKGSDLEKIKDLDYKKDVSKAYFTVELMNIIGGGRFDHDRHGKQLKIDTKNNVIGLFDTGAMAVVDPHPKDKELLGKILSRSIMDTMSSSKADFGAVATAFSAGIEKAYLDKETDSAYLTEVQRGLLALTDFYKDFDAKDFTECLNSALNNPDMPVDNHLMKGFVKEGISSIGVFEGKQSLLSHQDKENLGRLVFNVYSASQFSGEKSDIKSTISNEMKKLEMNNEKVSPLFAVISNGLQDKEGGKDFALSLPPQFIPSLSEVISQKDIDVPLLKGMMKEIVTSVDIQKENPRYSAEERQAFGKVIYATLDKILEAKKESKPLDAVSAFKQLCKENASKSDLTRNMSTILDFADSNPENGELNSKEIVKSLLFSGNMDKEITKGITTALVEKNENSVKRRLMAKGVEMILSQKSDKQSVVKKQLIKLFVKKNSGVGQIQTAIEDRIADKSISSKFVGVLKEKLIQYAEASQGKITQPSIVTSKANRTMVSAQK